MLRYLFNRKIFEKKIGLGQYSLKLNYFTRFFNVRIILSILVLLFVVFILKIWSECFTIRKNFFSNLFYIDNKTNFGEYNYVFSRETILERRSSRFHNITVAQSGSLRMLRFDTLDIQGVIHLENPYIMLLDYMRLNLLCLLWYPEPERILIIGLGAGILPRIFQYLSQNIIIDVVEIDPVVVDLARKYFDFNGNNLIQLYVEDGRHFIERQQSNQYDAIVIDVFTVHTRIPHTLRTLESFGEYLRILKPTGLVLGNFLYEQESRYRQTYARVLFKQIYRGITKNNYLLIGLNKDAKIFNQTSLQLRARALQQSKPLPDMNWLEETNYIHNANDDRWNISATIFTDQISEDFLGLSERN
jgi:spermidine synthase